MAEPREWKITIAANFEADNAEDAEAICRRLLDRVIEHPSSIEGEAWCEEVTRELTTPPTDGPT